MSFPLRLQFLIIALASVAMLSLAVFLIRDVISQTGTQRVEDAKRQLSSASQELRLQYDQREAFVPEDPLSSLPPEMRELSLRGLSETVLRTYPSVQGGYFLVESGEVAGASGGPVTAQVRDLVTGVCHDAIRSGGTAERVMEDGLDILVAAASLAGSREAAAWSVRQLSGVRDPVVRQRTWLLAALVFSAVLGMAAVVSVWYSLHAGVNSVRRGLAELEKDFQHRLPEGRGDFGRIARAINHMAVRRLALETELRRQERLAALGRAVAGVAHEIRNPLNSLQLSLELLSRRLAKGTATGQEVSGASREVDRLDRIVGRLLAFGRSAPADRQVQDPTPLMEQAVQMVGEQARRKDVRVTVENRSGSPLQADVDGPQLQQVLINLLLNAIDASPRGDKVEVIADSSPHQFVIKVIDHGRGVPEEAKPHIFDAYFTTKPDGVGLGLSVSREIVINHGGTLEYSSRPGRTEFVVTILATRSTPSETEGVGTDRRG